MGEDLRNSCTPGTRVDIREGISLWATDCSDDAKSVYWLSGQGGSGKTTIACSIARELESIITTVNGKAQLGGSFFCSESYPETRDRDAVIRTIVHQLARKCKAFKVALRECSFEAVDKGPRAQLEALLVNPWKRSALGRLAKGEPCYVISIDALDELEGQGGIELLAALFEAITKHDLKGLKFLITSRSEPELVERIEAFSNKDFLRLEEVPVEQTSADIDTYLRQNLNKCATDEQIRQLVKDASGLFIYAATVVGSMKGCSLKEQKGLLKKIVALSFSTTHRPNRLATQMLDKLYLHVLENRLVDPRHRDLPDVVEQSLKILHTILCTFERTSVSLVEELLDAAEEGNESEFETFTVDPDAVVSRLHAVLCVKDGRVTWFHKSFPDFMFDEKRSAKYCCNPDLNHRVLSRGCFSIMKNQLHFNIAKISTSFKLDKDNQTLSRCIEANIAPLLAYACQNWGGHLTRAPARPREPLRLFLSNFLELPVLFWLEAMNLLNRRGTCDGMLRAVQKWATQPKVRLNRLLQ
jgi:NACHT domain